MLGTLPNDRKIDWKSYVAPLVQAYNATKSEATGFSPHFLMFGTHPRLSVDAYLGLDPIDSDASSNHQSYAKKLRTRLKFAYDVAAKAAGKMGDKNKGNYDNKVRSNKLEVGDRVLVRKVGLKGRNKLADKWDEEPYLIYKLSDNDIPVYKVRLESGKGSVRTLHRNMLLPFNCIPSNVDIESNISRSSQVPVTPKTRHKKSSLSGTEILSESDSEISDQEDNVFTTQRQTRSRTSIPRVTISGGTPSFVDLSSIDHSDRYISHNETLNRAVSSPGSPETTAASAENTESFVSENRTTSPVVRRSSRQRAPPNKYGDWVYAQRVDNGDEVFV